MVWISRTLHTFPTQLGAFSHLDDSGLNPFLTRVLAFCCIRDILPQLSLY
jgi:hypothetical protein